MPARFLEDTTLYQDHFVKDVQYPYLAMIESSSRCNLLCVMCPRTVGKSPSSGEVYGDLSLDMLAKVESLMPHLDQVVLSWIGEPFLNRRIGEIVERIKRWPIHVHITTNGMLLNDHYAELVVTKKVDSVAVSIDGASNPIFEKIREGGSLDKIKGNIRHLADVKRAHGSLTPFLQVAFVAQPDNVHELPDMIDLVKDVGIAQFTVAPMDDFLLPNELHVSDSGALGPKDFARSKFYEMMRKAEVGNISIGIESPQRFYHEIGDVRASGEDIPAERFRNNYKPAELEAKGWRKACSVPWVHVIVGANGEVHPCCISPTKLGDLNENTIEEIWFGPKYQAFRKSLKSTRPHRDCWSCRRAIWSPATPIETMPEDMVAGEQEALGLGWNSPAFEVEPGLRARAMARTGTLFLRNGRKRLLSVRLGSRMVRLIRGTVSVNDVMVGTFRVGHGWRTFTYDLAQSDSEVLKVTIATEPRSPNLLMHSVRQEATTRNWRVPAPVKSIVTLPKDLMTMSWHAGLHSVAVMKPHLQRRDLKQGIRAVMELFPTGRHTEVR